MPENRNIINEKLLGILGIAMKAGRLVTGTEHVTDAVRRNGIPDKPDKPPEDGTKTKACGIVIIARDASANTKKRIINACAYYNIRYYMSDVSENELSLRLGKTGAVAVAATFDRGFVAAIDKIIKL